MTFSNVLTTSFRTKWVRRAAAFTQAPPILIGDMLLESCTPRARENTTGALACQLYTFDIIAANTLASAVPGATLARPSAAYRVCRCLKPGLDDPMLASRHPQGKLYALAVAIEASAARDPYPRLARYMRDLAIWEGDPRSFARPPTRDQIQRSPRRVT